MQTTTTTTTTKPKPAQIVAASFEAGVLVEREAWRAAIERCAVRLENNGDPDAALTVRLFGSVELERTSRRRAVRG